MLIVANNTMTFFRDALEASVNHTGIRPSEEAKAYLIHMLSDFCRSEKVFDGVMPGEKLIFFDMLEQAYNATDIEALPIFRRIGDTSLYLLGFFDKPNSKILINKKYCETMGSEGYSKASLLSRVSSAPMAALFQELSEQFPHLVILVKKIAVYMPPSDIN